MLKLLIQSTIQYGLEEFFVVSICPEEGTENKVQRELLNNFCPAGTDRDLFVTKQDSDDGKWYFPFVLVELDF